MRQYTLASRSFTLLLSPGLSALAGQPEGIAALVVMALAFIFFWFVGGLSCFHTWLVATNQTTYENFRQEVALGHDVS